MLTEQRFSLDQVEMAVDILEGHGILTEVVFADVTAAEFHEEIVAKNKDKMSFGVRKRLTAIHAAALASASAWGGTAGAAVSGDTRRCVVTSSPSEWITSSGGSMITRCDFSDALGTMHRGLTVKLSRDGVSLQRQCELLRLLNASVGGGFIGVYDCLAPSDVCAPHPEAVDCYALVMVTGGIDMSQAIRYTF
jgi:hypothetical protein